MIARFQAHFDTECDNCLAWIWQGDAMAYDRVNKDYLCALCADESEEGLAR